MRKFWRIWRIGRESPKFSCPKFSNKSFPSENYFLWHTREVGTLFEMVLLQYFKLKKQKDSLPDSNGPLSQKIPSSGTASADRCVRKLPVLYSSSNEGEGSSAGNSTSRGPYTVLTPAQNLEISKRAAEMGTTTTIRYYAKRYPDICLKETSVRRFKNNYQDGSC